MNSFLIRVYRNDADNDGVIGTVESLANGRRTTFHSFSELSQTLARQSRPGGLSPRKRTAHVAPVVEESAP